MTAKKSKTQILFGNLRRNYSEGFFSGWIFMTVLHFLSEDYGKGRGWFLSGFMLICLIFSFYFSWQSRKADYAQLKEIENELELSQRETPTS